MSDGNETRGPVRAGTAGGGDPHAGHDHANDDHSGHDHAPGKHAGHNHAGHDHSGGDHSGHDHDHGPGGHSHAPRVTAANERRLAIVLAVTGSYAVVQIIGGVISGSLALIADAGHMVSDAAALALALLAYRLAGRAADERRTYGFHRARVLAALANGVALLLLVLWIVWEAVGRLREPGEILAGPMLLVAIIGLGVNVFGAWLLSRGEGTDSNLRGAYLHVLGDLLGSVGAIAAAIGIMLTGWLWLDPVLSVLVAVLVLKSAWGLVRHSVGVLLQATPQGVDARKVEAEVAALPGVAEAGHFHAWTLTDERSVATIHVSADPGTDPLDLPARVASHLEGEYKIDHVTVQVDRPGGIVVAGH